MLSVVNSDSTTANGSLLIDEIVPEGARQMPASAQQAEVDARIVELADQRDANGRRVESAQARRRAVNAPHLVALVRAGARFERGRLIERPGVIAA
ncbi:hypothetical protein ACWEQN_39565 [Streptomyces sp. NPDC004129]